MKNQSKKGGKRPGAGRPRGPAKRPISLRISLAAYEWLQKGEKTATKNAEELIENAALTNNPNKSL